jgi:hypothetical protein
LPALAASGQNGEMAADRHAEAALAAPPGWAREITRLTVLTGAATVMFGEALEPGVFERAAAAAVGCDLMLAIGSTLIVEPAASLCAIAAEAGAALVIVNRDPTPYDMAATGVIRDPIGTAVPQKAHQLLAASRA